MLSLAMQACNLPAADTNLLVTHMHQRTVRNTKSKHNAKCIRSTDTCKILSCRPKPQGNAGRQNEGTFLSQDNNGISY